MRVVVIAVADLVTELVAMEAAMEEAATVAGQAEEDASSAGSQYAKFSLH